MGGARTCDTAPTPQTCAVFGYQGTMLEHATIGSAIPKGGTGTRQEKEMGVSKTLATPLDYALFTIEEMIGMFRLGVITEDELMIGLLKESGMVYDLVSEPCDRVD